MKPSDFARNGAKYLDRIDVFFDKALSRNGKKNRFATDMGVLEVAGFTVTRKQGKKYVTSPFQDFHDMKGHPGMENDAKMLFQTLCLEGIRGRNNIEFTCNFVKNKKLPAGLANLDLYLDLEDFIKTHEFGGQQRGGKKVNMGNQYENDLAQGLMDYCDQKEPKKYKEHIDIIINAMIRKYGEAPSQALGEGGKNQARPLKKKGSSIIISAGGATTNNIGSTLTDITLIVAGKPVYISVKFGSTLSFFNCGVRSSGKDKLALFPEMKMKSGEIPDDGKKYLDMFGIDYQKFLDVFEKYGTTNNSPVVSNHIEETTLSPSGKSALEDLIKSGVGYGYWMCHYTGSHLHFYEIDEKYMNDAAHLLSNKVEVNYGGVSGTGKRIDMVFETKTYEFKFNIRNKSGGVYPTHTNGDYYKK